MWLALWTLLQGDYRQLVHEQDQYQYWELRLVVLDIRSTYVRTFTAGRDYGVGEWGEERGFLCACCLLLNRIENTKTEWSYLESSFSPNTVSRVVPFSGASIILACDRGVSYLSFFLVCRLCFRIPHNVMWYWGDIHNAYKSLLVFLRVTAMRFRIIVQMFAAKSVFGCMKGCTQHITRTWKWKTTNRHIFQLCTFTLVHKKTWA